MIEATKRDSYTLRMSIRTWGVVGSSLIFVLAAAHPSVASDELVTAQKKIGVSPSLARVVDASWTDEQEPRYLPTRKASRIYYIHATAMHSPDFILIQDVHRDPEVQARIASLVLHGYHNWGVSKVFMEGAFTSLDLSLFHRIPKQVLPAMTRRLVYDGDLSGPELAALQIMEQEWSNPPLAPFQIFGLEEPALYKRNVMAYKAVLQKRDQALQDISFLRQQRQMLGISGPGAADKSLLLLEKLVRLKLTSQEYEEFLMYKDLIRSNPNLTEVMEEALEFYRLARMRSAAFMKLAMQIAPASTYPRILVVGGFHTDDMSRVLRDQGKSFVVLSPAVHSAPQRPLYEQRMQETVLVRFLFFLSGE